MLSNEKESAIVSAQKCRPHDKECLRVSRLLMCLSNCVVVSSGVQGYALDVSICRGVETALLQEEFEGLN